MKTLIVIAAFLLLATCGYAQKVERKGNTFTQVPSKGAQRQGKETRTQYVYVDTKGNSYPVYLSAQGKAFIKRRSAKTGKEYRQYLPEVGRQINPYAYKD